MNGAAAPVNGTMAGLVPMEGPAPRRGEVQEQPFDEQRLVRVELGDRLPGVAARVECGRCRAWGGCWD